ncbi:MAG: sigma-70 family RNA polymerase sigma factor [Clostridiales bacterium]|nr:sigma-70 family RNA polymerase sigma factor [Clostridiales bacterium]
MYENILRERLNTLYEDLTCSNNEAISLVNFMSECVDDKIAVIRDMYFHDHAPVRVLNPSIEHTGGSYDIEEEIIEISQGYDTFVKKLGNKTSYVLNKHAKALALFLTLMNLPDPYSRVLYLRYFKCLSVEDISEEMFISKSSVYRKHDKGISLLYELMSSKDA